MTGFVHEGFVNAFEFQMKSKNSGCGAFASEDWFRCEVPLIANTQPFLAVPLRDVGAVLVPELPDFPRNLVFSRYKC